MKETTPKPGGLLQTPTAQAGGTIEENLWEEKLELGPTAKSWGIRVRKK